VPLPLLPHSCSPNAIFRFSSDAAAVSVRTDASASVERGFTGSTGKAAGSPTGPTTGLGGRADDGSRDEDSGNDSGDDSREGSGVDDDGSDRVSSLVVELVLVRALRVGEEVTSLP
jgi:hypothetical protein